MGRLIGLLEVLAVCGAIFAALFLVLLAMPKSELRSFLLEIMGWTGAGLAAAATVSPIDVIPDFIPVLGQMDDLLYVIAGVVCAAVAYSQRRGRRNL